MRVYPDACLAACLDRSALLLLPSFSRDRAADITGFLGVTTTPSSRPAVGFAVGAGLLIVGFEFEYAHTNEDLTALAPEPRGRSCSTGCSRRRSRSRACSSTAKPVAAASTARRCRSRPIPSETNFGINIGGGAKISLVGPLRLRLDYRVFTLKGNPPSHERAAAVCGI